MPARIVVIGGGLHGFAAALHLARAGHRVSVVEKDYAGRHASGVNAGGVRRLGRHTAEIPLALAAAERWRRMGELVGGDCGFVPCGQVRVAESDADMDALEARVAEVRALGFGHEYLIAPGELRRRVPAIGAHCRGALVCDGDGYASPYRTVTAWRRAAQAAGAACYHGERVTGVERLADGWRVVSRERAWTADVVVNCAGAWAGEVCRMFGERVPVQAEAPMLMITERLAPFLEPVVGATHRPLSFKQFPNGTVLIGGGIRGRVEQGLAHPRLDGLAANARTVTDLFPFMARVRIVRTWAGVEGVMPDGIPVIGRSAVAPDVVHCFGFSAHGFQLGAITGEIVRDLVTGREPALPIAPFAVERFAAANPAGAPAY